MKQESTHYDYDSERDQYINSVHPNHTENSLNQITSISSRNHSVQERRLKQQSQLSQQQQHNQVSQQQQHHQHDTPKS
jgi:hypothetical protein